MTKKDWHSEMAQRACFLTLSGKRPHFRKKLYVRQNRAPRRFHLICSDKSTA